MTELDAYFHALSEADASAAVAVMDDATNRGMSRGQLIREVVVPAQRRVGQMWFDGLWTVADEHAATAVSEQALTLLAPPRAVLSPTTRVVVACAEGEWHTLPARLAAELTRTAGVDVVILGGSIPADHLRIRLRDSGADVLALSCTMPTNLIGAARSIAAAHSEGLPVIVGGRAWGTGQHRAQSLGAELHLADAGELLTALDEIAEPAPGVQPPALPTEALLLDNPAEHVLRLALERQCAATPWMQKMSAFQLARSLEDLSWLARHAAAAVACADPTIVTDLLDWLLGLLTPRGVPVGAVVDSCYFLADAVEPDAPRAAGVLRSSADQAHDAVSP